MVQDLFVFYLGEHRIGLPLGRIVRILQAVEVMELPNSPDVVLGMINVRGQLVPVVDVRLRFGLEPKELEPSDHMIMATSRGRNMAFVADASVGVVATNVGNTFSHDQLDAKTPWIDAVMRTIDGVVFIHDFDNFLSLEEAGVMADALSDVSKTTK